LGDEAFFAGMKNYLEKNKFQPAEFHQLRLAFEEVSGEDLNWFFNQWFLGSAHPILDFEQVVNNAAKTLDITVQQKQNLELSPIYKLPMEVAVFDSKGKHIHKVVVDELTEEISLPFEGELVGYIYDFQQAVLAKKRENKPREIYIHQYYNGERYLARLDGLENGSKGTSPESQQLILDAMNDKFWGIRIEAIGLAKKLNDENLSKGIEKLKELAINDPESSVRGAALAKLGKMMEADEVEPMYIAAISKDQSYSVISAALSALGQNNPDKALALAEPLESEKSSKMIGGIAQLYAGHAGPEKYEFFENVISGNVLQGYDKLGVIGAFTGFVAQQDFETFEKSYDLYKGLSETGGMYTQMFLPQFVGYIKKSCGTKIGELNTELAGYEENNDAAYASQTRTKISKFEALKVKYEALEAELLEKKSESQH
jgi:aminopeptidase N